MASLPLTGLILWLSTGILLGVSAHPAWLFAGVLLCGWAARRAPTPSTDAHLRRHLAICRRRGEDATVLCVHASGARRAALGSALRLSDSAVLRDTLGRTELVAVLDSRDLDRDALVARLRSTLGSPLTVGISTFPDEGATLDALVPLARRRAAGTPSAIPTATASATGLAPQ